MCNGLCKTFSGTLKSVLQKFAHDDPDVFTDVSGRTDLIQYDFSVKDGIQPVQMKPYRVPKAFQTEVQKELTKVLENWVLSRTTSKWVSPMVLVTKKTKP